MAEESVGGRSVRKSDCKSLMCDNCLCRLAHLHKLERTHVSDFLIEKENSGKKSTWILILWITMSLSRVSRRDSKIIKNCLYVWRSSLHCCCCWWERESKKKSAKWETSSLRMQQFSEFSSHIQIFSLSEFFVSHTIQHNWKYPNNPTCFLSPFQLFGVLATTFYPFFSMFEFSSSSEFVRVGSKTENFSGKLKWK